MSKTTTKPDIVVGVDGFDESFTALKQALEEASLTSRSANAVPGWTHSWDIGSEPDSDEAWAKVRHDIANGLCVWIDKVVAGIDFGPANLKLTPMKAFGASALLQIGHDSQQIVAGHRSLSRMARWFMGSLSASLAKATEVPVTVVRVISSGDKTMTEATANALTLGDRPVHCTQPQPAIEEAHRPMVAGADGSETSRRTSGFALEETQLHDAPLHVIFCWQLENLGVIPGCENATASVKVGQRRVGEILSELMAKTRIPDGVKVSTNAFHIPVSKGLITASRYASHLVVGSRSLSGLDAYSLGSMSRQIMNLAEYTVTVMR